MKQDTVNKNIAIRLIANDVIRGDFLNDTGLDKRKFYLCSSGRQKWSLEDLKLVARYFGCKFDDLFTEIPKQFIKNGKE